MREVVVVSGKGGTGKTSITGAFAALSRNVVLADCDVDAPDLELIVDPYMLRRESFSGGLQAGINVSKCTACGKCLDVCRFGAISRNGPSNDMVRWTMRVDPLFCEGCGVCSHFCPAAAVSLTPVVNGEWFVSSTRFGLMVHARLGVAQENSGKLVSVVRTQARRVAAAQRIDLILVDGPPGIGCPVIASMTGADIALVVSEPTLSGMHDTTRVLDLIEHFGIPALLVINKWDLNKGITAELERLGLGRNVPIAGRVPYDPDLSRAQIRKETIIEYSRGEAASEIRKAWAEVEGAILELDSKALPGLTPDTMSSSTVQERGPG